MRAFKIQDMSKLDARLPPLSITQFFYVIDMKQTNIHIVHMSMTSYFKNETLILTDYYLPVTPEEKNCPGALQNQLIQKQFSKSQENNLHTWPRTQYNLHGW